ncbi:MAG: hypothetical protein M3Q79_03320 [bacterium]|nr:hypothetical protein [bacterium]
MALDFTKIKDEPGSAIIMLHDGTTRGQREFERLAAQIQKRTKKQLVLLSVKDSVGHSIVSFYGLRGTKFVLIVRDDDQLHHHWTDGNIFDPSEIAYSAEQAG